MPYLTKAAFAADTVRNLDMPTGQLKCFNGFIIFSFTLHDSRYDGTLVHKEFLFDKATKKVCEGSLLLYIEKMNHDLLGPIIPV